VEDKKRKRGKTKAKRVRVELTLIYRAKVKLSALEGGGEKYGLPSSFGQNVSI
jgi:hypothetical protein